MSQAVSRKVYILQSKVVTKAEAVHHIEDVTVDCKLVRHTSLLNLQVGDDKVFWGGSYITANRKRHRIAA